MADVITATVVIGILGQIIYCPSDQTSGNCLPSAAQRKIEIQVLRGENCKIDPNARGEDYLVDGCYTDALALVIDGTVVGRVPRNLLTDMDVKVLSRYFPNHPRWLPKAQ